MTARKPFVLVGNASWEPRSGLGQTGPWATFGLVDDDGCRFEVSAFGGTAQYCCRAVVEGTRLRVESKSEPEQREWTSRGEKREGLHLVASRVEVLEALPAGEARRKILDRIMATPASKVLEV